MASRNRKPSVPENRTDRERILVEAPDCRFCGAGISRSFVNLGVTPLCQTHISPDELNKMEPFYPLHALVCDRCLLVQLDEFVAPADIFEEYAYFSSYSSSWLDHARRYCEMAATRFALGASSRVVEIASNDGYLLRNFVEMGIPCLGIEPAKNVADEARKVGVESVNRFFGIETAGDVLKTHGPADLIIGNNVVAHVPDLNDFVGGIAKLLADDGVLTLEFPHLKNLVEQVQFDTIYHEHFSYFSFISISRVLEAHGLEVFDVEQLATHGGSLRVFAKRVGCEKHTVTDAGADLLRVETDCGYGSIDFYTGFQPSVDKIKRDLLSFLVEQKAAGKSIVGYGAPGKGNTLLNYCGIGPDFLDYTVDQNPYKQGKYTPGTRIPILDPSRIKETQPDYLLVLPWNLIDEISSSHSYVSEWGGKFVVPIPSLHEV